MHPAALLPQLEALTLKGSYKGTIYQRLVAARYTLAPSYDPAALPAFKDLIRKFSRQFGFLQSQFTYEPVSGDPYKSSKHLSREIRKQQAAGVRRPVVKVLAAEPGPEDEADRQGHPLFDNEFNVQFRWVHDVIAHHYGGHPFTARGEYAAYNRHLKTLGPRTPAAAALFTEVVGQTSCFYVYGGYTDQKAVILPDFDHQNVGLLAPSSPLNRYFEVVGKTMVVTDGFDPAAFAAEFPDLHAELRRQEQDNRALSPLTAFLDTGRPGPVAGTGPAEGWIRKGSGSGRPRK